MRTWKEETTNKNLLPWIAADAIETRTLIDGTIFYGYPLRIARGETELQAVETHHKLYDSA